MQIMKLFLIIAALGLVTAGAAVAEDADQLMKDSHMAYYYAADGGHAKVEMTVVDKKGRERVREFWMLRRDVEDMGDQRYYTYFIAPADVRRTAFLVHKHADGNDDRWLYIPALDLVKRIAADDRSSSFVGSDFTYEDVSGRLPVLDAHELLGEESLGERPTFKVKSTPKEAGTADWDHKLSWICQETKLPLKEEYYDKKGALVRIFSIETVEIKPRPPMRRTIEADFHNSSSI